MKRLFLALAFVAAPAAMQAQTCTASPCNATPITTAVTVKSAVSFGVGGNLNFGVVAGGTTAAVDAQGTSATGGTPGSVILSANQAVTVTAAFAPLTSAGLPNLTVSAPSCGYSTTATTSTVNTTLFTCGTGYTSPATGTGATGIYVWMGGSVATTASTPAGTYAGTATATGTYTVY